jgi:hypothetical protein
MRSRVGAAVGAILLLLAGPVPAQADPFPGGPGTQYYWLACPEGTASTGSFVEIYVFDARVYFSYDVTLCVAPGPFTAMAMGFYYPDGHADGKIHPYAYGSLSSVALPTGAEATCLLSAPHSRLDCYELVWTGVRPTVGQRLSPSDPRVAAVPTIGLYLSRDPGGPNCPLCP